ncbi:hypothetical protein RYX36_006777 [Vicia faba]
MQAGRDSSDPRVSKKESKQSTQNQAIYVICHKVKHLFPEENLKLFYEKFLNKPIQPKYYVEKSTKIDLKKGGKKVYDDQIVEPEKSYTNDVDSSNVGVLSADVGAYFGELFGKIMENN